MTQVNKSCQAAACEDILLGDSMPVGGCEAPCPDPTDGLDPEMLEKLCQIVELLENPIPVGIELGSIEVGCVPDADGNAIGKVYMCIVKDEANSTTTTELKAVLYADGSVISPYSGEIAACTTGKCPEETPLGVITDLSQL